VVRKESRRATELVVLSITVFLVACENDRPRASKTGSADPNKAFAEYAAARTPPPANLPGLVRLEDVMDFPAREAHLVGLAKAAFSVASWECRVMPSPVYRLLGYGLSP
jgi:hypothetical protein